MNSNKSRLSRIRDWNRKRRQKSEEKKRIIEEIKSRKSLAEKTEKTTPQPITEETKELTPEPITEKTEKTTPQPITEETKELTPEPITEKTEKTTPNLHKLGVLSFFKKRRQKKRETEIRRDPEWIKILTVAITLVSMLLGLSLLPLFPQPLPVVLAFLIAFVTLKKPVLGMPIGGLLIGLGLMYNLAKLDFIVMLGGTEIRWIVVFLFLFLFTALPIVFRDRRSAITINLGIIAAISLFSSLAFFLAIPLIVSSIVLFKRKSILSVVYYVLLSVPLQIMQYLTYVTQIARVDWWVEAGSNPPIYIPLTQIFTDVQDSMLQFRLYDTSKVIFAISDQLTLDPPVMEHTVMEMLSHYIDSLPGIILFIVMIIGIVSAIVLFARTTFSQTNIGGAEKILPIITGIAATILFFVLANSLQDPLAFRVDLSGSAMVLGTFAVFIFTIPIFFMDQTPKERTTVDMIEKKCQTLLEKLLGFEEALNIAKTAIPISFSALETRSIISKDKLEDINSKNSKNLLAPSEIDEVLKELNKLEKAIDNLDIELDVLLSEYQIFANCENSKWKGQFENIGIKLKNNTITKFDRGVSLENRLDCIKEIIESSRAITEEIIEVTEQIYDGIRSLFDPNLPKDSQSIIFARKNLDEKVAPWNVLDTLYVSLINMKKNYQSQIASSIEKLKHSLIIINNFSRKNEKLSIALDEDYPKLIKLAKKVEDFQINLDKENFSIIAVTEIKKVFDSTVGITKGIFSILFENLKRKEKTIESLMPPEGYMWGKNLEIVEKMASAIKMFKGTSKLKSSKVLEKLPSFLSLAEDGRETIIAYKEKEELLLNYPIAEIVVEEQLKKKKKVTANDLPFAPKYSLEYLKLFHSKRYHESSFDKTNNILSSKK